MAIFIAKAGEPIITTEWYSFHRIYADNFALHTVQQNTGGLCSLFGQPSGYNDTVTGTLTGVSQSAFTYTLAIDGQAATLYEDSNQTVPSIIVKSCNFPTDANAQIPCSP